MKIIYILLTLLLFTSLPCNSKSHSLFTNKNVLSPQNNSVQIIQLNFFQPDELKIKATSKSINLLKGDIFHSINSIKISGGSGHYLYFWKFNPWNHNYSTPTISVSPPESTNFTLLITDIKGCTIYENFRINVIPPLQVDFNKTEAGCFGGKNGSIHLNVSKGAPPYKYQWSNGKNTESISDLKAGNYQVTISDSMDQTVNKEFEITELQRFQTSVTASICDGQTYSIGNKIHSESGQFTDTLSTITGCDSIIDLSLTLMPSYRDTIKTIQCADDYSFQEYYPFYPSGFITDSSLTSFGCDSLIVNNLTIILVTKPIITIMGDTLSSTASPLCLWFKNGEQIKESNNPKYIIKSSGTYMVHAFSEYGCNVASDNVSVIYSDNNQLNNYLDCSILPNPNNGYFTIKIQNEKKTYLKLQLFSPDGRIIFSKSIVTEKNDIEIPMAFDHLPKGIYLLKVDTGQKISNHKIIIQ